MAITQPSPAAPVGSVPLTHQIASWAASLGSDDITPQARRWATHALLDWAAVTLAAKCEPLVSILADELATDQPGRCTVVGQGRSTSPLNAALINGAAAHALDYDDVSRAMNGHPTVPVVPAVLALAEELGATGREILDAIVAGVEAECALGEMTQGGHYAQGFHATGTLGCFGAAVAASRLMGLNAEATARALAIAGTQAAGLKCNFGTMVKPFHAGKAASNGLLAARLAARGFTANPETIETAQGFADALCPDFVATSFRPDPRAPYEIEKTLFKYHAACYSTHAMLEAVKDLRHTHAISLDDFEHMTIYVHTRAAGNCSIPDPTTGLQVKFSLRHLAVMALDGVDTAALETYTDANANAAPYMAARQRVAVDYDAARDRMTTRVVIDLKDGRTLVGESDTGQPAANLDAQWSKLSDKFTAIASGPLGGTDRSREVIETIAKIENAPDIAGLMAKIG
jgi:2-methylcitrate dehydratase PrpD